MARRSIFVTGMIAGTAGVVAGLLFAPKQGRETRHMVLSRASEVRHKTGHLVGSLRHRVPGDDSVNGIKVSE